MNKTSQIDVASNPSLKHRVTVTLLVAVLAISIASLFFSMPQAVGHSPLTSGENESLETATTIPEPAKSWAIYAELHKGGEAQYYRFNITRGERIYIMLLKSTRSEEEEFMPIMILMGPGLPGPTDVPDYVEIPPEAGALAAESEQPAEATYEPFSPSSFYSLAKIDRDAPATGTYYIAVHELVQGGHYGLAVGYIESYTLTEWLLIPVNLISVYQWDGQNLVLIFAPLVATIIIGLCLIWWMRFRETPWTVFDLTAALAGLLFMASGVSILFQMTLALTKTSIVTEVVLTLVFAAIPIILGAATLRLILKRKGTVNTRLRIYMVILGIAALFAWAGLLIGPALALVASILPSRAITQVERK